MEYNNYIIAFYRVYKSSNQRKYAAEAIKSFVKITLSKVKAFENDRYEENEDRSVYIKSNLKCSF